MIKHGRLLLATSIAGFVFAVFLGRLRVQLQLRRATDGDLNHHARNAHKRLARIHAIFGGTQLNNYWDVPLNEESHEAPVVLMPGSLSPLMDLESRRHALSRTQLIDGSGDISLLSTPMQDNLQDVQRASTIIVSPDASDDGDPAHNPIVECCKKACLGSICCAIIGGFLFSALKPALA